jgi:uncharacterized membrane protein YeaQ/YmgE (transglycosylase-associated protein family)
LRHCRITRIAIESFTAGGVAGRFRSSHQGIAGSLKPRRHAREAGNLQVHISNQGILVVLFIGLVAGWLAGKIVRGTGFGLIGDILVGIAGALVANLLLPKLGIHIGTGVIREIINAVIGAVILLLVVRAVRGRR